MQDINAGLGDIFFLRVRRLDISTRERNISYAAEGKKNKTKEDEEHLFTYYSL